jgi:hypothetical protein
MLSEQVLRPSAGKEMDEGAAMALVSRWERGRGRGGEGRPYLRNERARSSSLWLCTIV